MDAYNADEIGHFYQSLSEQTFALRGETCTCGKHSKVRITTLFCCNIDGMDNRKILVTRKSKNPCCFIKVTLPVEYSNNKNIWMTSEIFSKWLENFEKEIAQFASD